MAVLRIELFGRLQISGVGLQNQDVLSHTKALELLAYLLLHPAQAHARESLITLLWGDGSPSLSRKYLRKAIWQLQTALRTDAEEGTGLLKVEDEWLSINHTFGYWLDVAVFERSYALVREHPAEACSPELVSALREAVALYKGNLLEGWYQDWCLFERQRLQNQYFLMLDKLMAACESLGQYERGIAYGMELLRHDLANERAYRRLMRLHYLFGDRTASLHLYRRCAAVLKSELGVNPAQETLALYHQICQDRLDRSQPAAATETPQEMLAERIRLLQQNLDQLLSQVQQSLQSSSEELAE
jgi:DNA-binding SARP family transcriptional activator